MVENTQLEYTYYAFISYKREDEKWAKWLQKKLESYGFPVGLRKDNPTLPSKIRPVFRDQSDLSGGNLKAAIERGLRESKYLIVICSPRSAQSPWVSREVQYFIDHGKENEIIPFIIGGTPNAKNPEEECFPEGLRQLSGEKEILGININEMGSDAAAIKVIARMFDLRFDSLWQRHVRAKRKNMILIEVICILFICLGLGIYQYVNHQKNLAQQAEHDKNTQMLYMEFMRCEKLYNENKKTEAFVESQKIVKTNLDMPKELLKRYEYLLRMSLSVLQSDTLTLTNHYRAEFPAMDWGDMSIAFNEKGDRAYIGCSGFTVIDVATGKSIVRNPDLWPSKFSVIGDKIYAFDDYEIASYSIRDLKKLSSYSLSSSYEDYRMIAGCSADGLRFLAVHNHTNFGVFDTSTGRLINSFQGNNASINYNGKVIAVGRDGEVYLYDVDTGSRISYESDKSLYGDDLKFDESGKWLLLYLSQNDDVRVLNIDTKESYIINDIKGYWNNSFNFDGNVYGNKYIVSDDDRYIAIGPNIYDMADGKLAKNLISIDDNAMGLKIFPELKKVIQINLDQEIYEYTRNGNQLFEISNLNFQELMQKDESTRDLDIEISHVGDVSILNKNGDVIGVIPGIDGDLYMMSITPNKEYIIISSNAIPTSVFDMQTGILVQKFPFQPGDGDYAFGVFADNNTLYINGLQPLKYFFMSLDDLLKVDIEKL